MADKAEATNVLEIIIVVTYLVFGFLLIWLAIYISDRYDPERVTMWQGFLIESKKYMSHLTPFQFWCRFPKAAIKFYSHMLYDWIRKSRPSVGE